MSDRLIGESSQSVNEAGIKMSLSVIIPTRNGGTAFRELLASLSVQSLQPDEILVIDSDSEDETVEIAREYGASVLQITRDEFDHGATRTEAARRAGGDILIFLTQDVLPASPDLLEILIRPILKNSGVDLSYARQLPAFNATGAAAHLRYFNYPQTTEIRTFADRHQEGIRTVFGSNSCAAYRRSSLAEIGFFEAGLIFGEDSVAAGKLLERGGKISYTADAAVYHSHNYRWNEELRRYFDIGVFHAQCSWLTETYGGAGRRGTEYIRSGLRYLWSSRSYSMIGDFMVRVGLKFCGYRLGRMHHLLPVRAARFLSMNQQWWDKKNTRSSDKDG
ncbi:MAG: glycosyltransferase family 2 protein [Desulfofustis sp.]